MRTIVPNKAIFVKYFIVTQEQLLVESTKLFFTHSRV